MITRWKAGVAFAGLTVVLASGCTRQVEVTSGGEVVPVRRGVSEMIATWPEKQRETANMLVAKYGEPSVTGDRMLVWFNTGPFDRTVLMRDAVPHNFPMPHMDYLAQTVKHRVPLDKLDELYAYDGSVWYQRTRGELSAQCDLEPANFLALNLAHDVITGRRSVSDARSFYSKTIMEFKQGNRSSPYVTGLRFTPEPNAPDPDQAHRM